MKRFVLALAAALALPMLASAASMPAGVVVIPGDGVKWVAGTGEMKGMDSAVLAGDPSKTGSLYTMRLRFPSGFAFPAHSHKGTEQVTVLSGTLLVGLGKKLMPASEMKALGPGSFVQLPPGIPHFARTKGVTVIELHGVGPYTTDMIK